MKDSVDLTQNRVFRNQTQRSELPWGEPIKKIVPHKKKFPWEEKEIFFSERKYPEEPPFFTGTKSEIHHKIEIYKLSQNLCCIMCGKPIKQTPWDLQQLCTECQKSIDSTIIKNKNLNIIS